MKKVFFAIAAMAALMSCQKFEQNKVNVPELTSEKVQCTFNLAGDAATVETKATGLESDAAGITSEKAVNTLQVYAFTSAGNFVASQFVSEQSSISLSVNAGTGYQFYALVNLADLTSSITSISDFDSVVANNLDADNGSANFAMQGMIDNQTVSADSKSFTIEVARRAAKVVLRKVTNSLPAGSGSLTIESIFIENVVATEGLFSASVPTGATWINKQGKAATMSSRAWFCDVLASPATVNNGGNYSTAHTFYAAANDTAEDTSDATWSARYTRIVVKAKIQGVDYYYPISFNTDALPALTPNSYIDITNLTIKHLGSDDPDKPISSEDVTLTVTVKDWSKVDKTVEI